MDERGMIDDIEAELFEVFGEHRADDSTISKVRTLIAWHREEVDFIGQVELLLGLDGDPGEIPNAIRKLIEERDHLRARVAELEAAHLAIAEAIDMVDHCEGQGAIVPDPSHVALTCGAMWRESLEAGEREDRARREGAEAMRERAVAALDRGVRLWPANSEGRGAAVAARETVRALPLDLDAGG